MSANLEQTMKALEVTALRVKAERDAAVKALRDLTSGVGRLQLATKAEQQAVALPQCRALALLGELERTGDQIVQEPSLPEQRAMGVR